MILIYKEWKEKKDIELMEEYNITWWTYIKYTGIGLIINILVIIAFVTIAWLLSSVSQTIPIPGTSQLDH